MSVIWQLFYAAGSTSKFFNDFLDNIPLQDQVTISIGNLQFQPQVSDNLSFSDSFTFQIGGAALGILLPVEDILFLDSSIVLNESFLEDVLNDNVLLTDFPTVALICLLKINDTLALSDILQTLIGSSAFSDLYSLSDSISTFLTGNIQVSTSDSLGLNDSQGLISTEFLNTYLRRYLNDVQ